MLLAPLLMPIALLARLIPGKKTEDRSADEVAGYIRDLIEGTGGDWDWDHFECVPITDPKLDRIRQAAALAGPKNSRNDADFATLRRLLIEAEGLAKA